MISKVTGWVKYKKSAAAGLKLNNLKASYIGQV